MATSAAAALLDELMGRTRNFDPNERPPDLHWNDETVCKHFLCGFCPHELFTNTRADLGLCNKIHDEALRQKYQESDRFEKEGFEEDFLRFLQNMMSDVDKRIRRGHQRLALNNAQNFNGGFSSAKDEKIELLTNRINDLISQAEELGGEGNVEQAQGVMKLCDQLREERIQIQNQTMHDDGGPQMKEMEVCEVCGAFLIVGDAPQRQDEHLMGKQHAGYAQVRAEIEKRKMQKKAELEDKERKRQQEREDKDREIEREREDRRKREKEREDREKRDRDRTRDRDRRRRSRSRDRRSRSRDKRRSGSRERRRSRDRRRRSRSKSRDRRSSKSSRRSRSNDKDSNSSRRDKDRRRDRDRNARSRSKDGERGKKHGSSGDRGSDQGKSPEGNGARSEGDSIKD